MLGSTVGPGKSVPIGVLMNIVARTFAAALLLVTTAFCFGPATPATAGTFASYPEFPYAETGYNEPYRGQFHFSARSGWMNDPNGMIYYRGTYHLFFQHNPETLVWSTMHWGHATSTDMVHWTQKPIALEPDVHPGDLFSGNAIVDTANVTGLKTGSDDPIIMYSGTNGVIIHYSTDGARTFQTFDHGRKVVIPPGESRDPFVFWHAASGRWVMVVYSTGGGNAATFYTSLNLLDWTLRSRFALPPRLAGAAAHGPRHRQPPRHLLRRAGIYRCSRRPHRADGLAARQSQLHLDRQPDVPGRADP